MSSTPHDAADALPLFAWSPPPKVLPFPSVRRRELIWRCARRMAELKPVKAAEHLTRLLEQQRDVQARRGIDPTATAADLAALRSAILSAYAGFGRRLDGGAA